MLAQCPLIYALQCIMRLRLPPASVQWGNIRMYTVQISACMQCEARVPSVGHLYVHVYEVGVPSVGHFVYIHICPNSMSACTYAV